jgi:hypothetical protein
MFGGVLFSNMPDPSLYSDWRAYSSDLRKWFELLPETTRVVDPQAVQLAHANTELGDTAANPKPDGLVGGLPRATVEGLLMLDPVLKAGVISRQDGWRALLDVALGGMRTTVNGTTVGSNITAAWQTLTAYAEEHVGPAHVSMNTGTGVFGLDTEGVFEVSVLLNLDVTASGSNRNLQARLYDIAGAAGLQTYTVPVAANTDSIVVEWSEWLEIDTADVGDTYRVEVSAPDGDLAGVVWTAQVVLANRVSPVHKVTV